MHGPCLAYVEDGRVCRAPATQLDGQRGGLVCAAHAPVPGSSRPLADPTMRDASTADAAAGRPPCGG